jgi:NADPH2:quinone reductase
MRAAVIETLGGEPTIAEFPEPTPDDDVAAVLAAPLNPVDLIIVAGQMPFRQAPPPFVAGVEGIARLSNGQMRYFSGPKMPYGSLAERVPLAGAETVAVPAGLDPTVAAALGVSGLAAWLSLTQTGRLEKGERVLVLGAEGQVGKIATQAARLLGASRVVGAVLTEEGVHVALDAGADAAVSTADAPTLADRLRAAAPEGVDLILDMVWGPVIGPALEVARMGARVVQVGNSGGMVATVSAPVFRNKLVKILSHSNFVFSPAERAAAYEQLAAHAESGAIRVDVEQVAFADAPAAWQRLKTGAATRKLVVVP